MSDTRVERRSIGPRGPRGKRGPAGPTGPAGGTGATGPTGPSGVVDHVEDQSTLPLGLPASAQTQVLLCPPITAPVGQFVQITALVNVSLTGNTSGQTKLTALLYQDGTPIAEAVVTPGAVGPVGGFFELDAALPVVCWLPGDGLSHAYSVNVVRDAADGTGTASGRSIFVNVV